MPVPVHELGTTEQYLVALDGHRTQFAPGDTFHYNNGAYVVLALVAERVSGVAFHELVRQRVCLPSGLRDTGFLRSDELPARAATGYLTSNGTSRTNVFHLPVCGSGDGGIYSTAADVSLLWTAIFDGRVVSLEWVSEIVRARSDAPQHSMQYGLGFWLGASSHLVILEGCDAGVSFRSEHNPIARTTYTVISNSSDGAWPIARLLRDRLSTP